MWETVQIKTASSLHATHRGDWLSLLSAKGVISWSEKHKTESEPELLPCSRRQSNDGNAIAVKKSEGRKAKKGSILNGRRPFSASCAMT
jgi:hypothetical protein